MKKLFLLFTVLLCIKNSSFSQNDSILQVPFGVSLYVEEDSFNSKFNEDRNYTGGGALTFTGRHANCNLLLLPLFRKGIDRLIGIDKTFRKIEKSKPYLISNSFSFGLTVFTPENIGTPLVVVGDRPYAFMEFISSKQIRVWKGKDGYSDRLSFLTELNVGILGLDHGDSLQTWIHRSKIKKHPNDSTNRPLPLGWHNQISRGGEVTAMYKIAIQNRIRTVYWKKKNNQFDYFYKLLELSTAEEVNLGYYTNVSIGFTLKVGLFNSSFWQAGTNYGSAINGLTYRNKNKYDDNATTSIDNNELYIDNLEDDFTKEDLRIDTYKNFEIYAIASARRKIVGYNVLLQGQFRESNYVLNPNEICRVIDEFELAIVMRLWRLNFIYEPIAGRTSELNTSYARTHIWGAFHVSYNMPFL